MKLLVINLSFLLISLINYSQNEIDTITIYYNKNWSETTKDSAVYFRKSYKEGDLFKMNDYYLNGNLQMTGYSRYPDTEEKEGLFQYFYKNGQISSAGEYKSNKVTGEWTEYDSLGNLSLKQFYLNGKNDGEYIKFYPNGNIKTTATYSNGTLLNSTSFTIEGKKIKTKDRDASFKGGQKKLYAFIGKKLKYPTEALEKNITGKVFVSFEIDQNGKVINAYVSKKSHPLLDQEALSIIQEMPKWKPAIKDGQFVKSKMIIPINFKLE